MSDRKAAGRANQPTQSFRGRRWLLAASVGSVAAVGGAIFARWRLTLRQADSDAAQGLWTQTFETPAGPPLAMSSFRGRPLLLNFWATWCPPCVDELPMLEAFYREQSSRGWQLVGLAIDQPGAVRRFLRRLSISFPIGIAGLEGTRLSKALGNTAGGLPFTLMIAADGTVKERKMGQLTPEDLRTWAENAETLTIPKAGG